MKIRLTHCVRVALSLSTALLLTFSAARAADEPVQIPHLLMQAKAAVATLPEMEDRAHALCRIARVQAAAGYLNGALGTIESIGQLHSKGRNDFIIIRSAGLAEIAGVQVKRRDVQGAYAIAKRVDDDLMKSEVYASIASAQVENGDLDGALQTAKRVSGEQDHFMPLRAPIFAQIAHAYIQRGDLDAAERVLDADRDNKSSRAMAVKGDVASAIITEKIKRGRTNAVTESAHNLTDSVARASYGRTAAAAFADIGKFGDAFAALELISIPHWREETLAAIAAAQARQGDGDGAGKTVSQISSRFGQAVGWKTVANAYIAKGEKEKARRVVEQVQPCKGRESDDSSLREFCGSFADVFVDLGDFAQAKEAISRIADQNQRWTVLRGIIRRLSLARDFEHAQQLADLGSTEAHRMQFYKTIAVGMELSGASEDALRFAKNSIAPAFRDRTLVEMAKVRTRLGHIHDALDLVSQVNDRQAKVDAIVGIAESQLPTSLRKDDLLSEADALVKPPDRE